jgi:hypothetical protein
MDPGVHELSASAPGRRAWRTTVTIGATQLLQAVNVPSLEVETAKAAASAVASPPAQPTTSGRRTAAWIAGGVGIAALGVGAYFGLRAASKHSLVTSECPGNVCPDETGKEDNDQSRTFARISDVAFPIGVVGVGVGAYLLLTQPSAPPASDTVAGAPRLVPIVEPHFAGVGASGAF